MLIFIIMGKVLFMSFIYAVTAMNSGISISRARIIIIVQMLI
ncbi:putative membrane protein [Escherichia coli 3-475-03_S4_C2]|nr:putative membrane protein [Escherichia coli 3-105-05_S1_C1]KDU50546.1 putative membrane protein [Escherichia coli 3-475-03_S4_C2]